MENNNFSISSILNWQKENFIHKDELEEAVKPYLVSQENIAQFIKEYIALKDSGALESDIMIPQVDMVYMGVEDFNKIGFKAWHFRGDNRSQNLPFGDMILLNIPGQDMQDPGVQFAITRENEAYIRAFTYDSTNESTKWTKLLSLGEDKEIRDELKLKYATVETLMPKIAEPEISEEEGEAVEGETEGEITRAIAEGEEPIVNDSEEIEDNKDEGVEDNEDEEVTIAHDFCPEDNENYIATYVANLKYVNDAIKRAMELIHKQIEEEQFVKQEEIDRITDQLKKYYITASEVEDLIAKSEKRIAANQTAIENITKSSEKLDKEINQAIDDIKNGVKDTQEKVVSVVASLNGDGLEYSAIAQLKDCLALKVGKDDVVSAINMAPEGVKIDGKYLNITGDTVFDKSVDINGMLSAGSITADKLGVHALSAISANLGEVHGGTIIGCEFHNEDSSAGIDKDGNIYGSTITGSQLKGNEISSSMIEGSTMKGGSIRGARIYGAYIEGAVIKEGEGGLEDFEQATITAVHGTKLKLPDWFSPNKSLVYLKNIENASGGQLSTARDQDKIFETKFGICSSHTSRSCRYPLMPENEKVIRSQYSKYVVVDLGPCLILGNGDGDYYLYAYTHKQTFHGKNNTGRWDSSFKTATFKVVNI